tara:strand:- start:1100 stop:2026 length:927 start_codon:yes stop_codon:yes gene_type:complete
MRQSAEKEMLLDAEVSKQLGEIRRLEVRNEQLQGEKERLLYDNELQRRGRPIDDAIRRGLQAEPSQPYLPSGTDQGESGGPSPPPSLPPGPPSSTAGSASRLPPTTACWHRDGTCLPSAVSCTASTHPTSALASSETSELDEMSDTSLSELLDLGVLAELSEPELTSAFASSSTAAVRAKTGSFNSPVQNESSISPAQEPQQTVISLQEAFARYVMCDFTPRSPNALPMMRWVSVDRLLRHLQPHAPVELFAQLTPNKLKHLITEWFHDHPVYAGLSFNEWCKRLKDRSDPLARPRSQAVHFPFEHTP